MLIRLNVNNYKIYFLLLTALLLVSTYSHAACLPEFHYEDKWLGADAAYSVELSKGKTLWLFGDTFKRTKKSSGLIPREFTSAGFVYSSIGISECGKKITYFFGKDRKDFFEHPLRDIGFKFWPKDGVVHKGKLYIILLEVETIVGDGFGFKETGTSLAIIDNPSDHPDKWKMNYHTLVKSELIFPGSALVIQGEDLIMLTSLASFNDFGEIKRQSPFSYTHTSPIVMTKLNLQMFEENNSDNEISVLMGSGEWTKINLSDDESFLKIRNQLKFLSYFGLSEMSLTYKPNLKRKWHIVFSGPTLQSNEIYHLSSKSLFSGWSKPKAIYTYPESIKSSDRYIDQLFCYAAKEHSQYSDVETREIVLTYVCNSFNPDVIINEPKAYLPVFVKLKLPTADKAD